MCRTQNHGLLNVQHEVYTDVRYTKYSPKETTFALSLLVQNSQNSLLALNNAQIAVKSLAPNHTLNHTPFLPM